MGKFAIFFLFCLLLNAFQPAESIQGIQAPDQRFGMTESFWLPEEARDLGVGWERILFYWREIQPEGPDDWNTLHVREEWLAQANSQGRIVVGLLKNTAPWASEDGTEAGVPRGLYLPTDDPDNLWARFVEKIAAYYGPRNIHHWVIWNEPEIPVGIYGHEFNGSTADYYQLLKVAYIVLKETDPKATIHLAGVTWWHDKEFLRHLFELMANDPSAASNNFYFDVISLHIYFRTETIRTIISAVKEIEEKFGLDKPIWLNETNAPPNLDPEWPVDRPVFDVNLDQQSWFIVQAFSLAFAEGVARASVYKLLDIDLPPGGESFGIIRTDLSRRPAYETFKVMTTYMSGFSDVQLEEFPEYYQVSFIRPDSTTHVLWSRTEADVLVEVSTAAETAQIIEVNGQTSSLFSTGGSYEIELAGARCNVECIIGGPPVFLLEREESVSPDVWSTGSALELANEPKATSISEAERLTETPTATPLPSTIVLLDTPVTELSSDIKVTVNSSKPIASLEQPTPLAADGGPTSKPEEAVNVGTFEEKPMQNTLMILGIGAFFIAGIILLARHDRKTN